MNDDKKHENKAAAEQLQHFLQKILSKVFTFCIIRSGRSKASSHKGLQTFRHGTAGGQEAPLLVLGWILGMFPNCSALRTEIVQRKHARSLGERRVTSRSVHVSGR